MRRVGDPGSDPNARATVSVTGNRMPPARAVLDGVMDAITRSASAMAYPSRSGRPPSRWMMPNAMRSPNRVWMNPRAKRNAATMSQTVIFSVGFVVFALTV